MQQQQSWKALSFHLETELLIHRAPDGRWEELWKALKSRLLTYVCVKRAADLVQKDDAVDGAADGGVLVSHHDVRGDAAAGAGPVAGGAGMHGAYEILHHRGRHRVQPSCRLIIHHNLCSTQQQDHVSTRSSYVVRESLTQLICGWPIDRGKKCMHLCLFFCVEQT